MRPYLSILFPGSSLTVDEDFRVAGILCGGEEGASERLSEGTLAQIAVPARLAFAEMLVNQGKPAAFVLDDALVYSDDDRTERMCGMASRKTPIIVLSCKRGLAEGLGGHRLALEREEETLLRGEASGQLDLLVGHRSDLAQDRLMPPRRWLAGAVVIGVSGSTGNTATAPNIRRRLGRPAGKDDMHVSMAALRVACFSSNSLPHACWAPSP